MAGVVFSMLDLRLAARVRAAVIPFAITLAAGAATATAQSGLDSPAAEQARPSLIAEVTSIAPGETILIGITFDIEPGWHTYWHGRNDTVPGPWFEFSAPEGFEIGALQWPAPQRYESSGMLDHIYERRVTLVAPLTAPGTDGDTGAIEGDSVTISVKANWTVCSDVCLMADATLELELPVAARSGSPGPDASRFAETRKRLPRALHADDRITVERTADRIEIRAADATRMAFYPHEKGAALASILRDGEARGDALTLRLRQDNRPSGQGAAEPLPGLLAVWREGSREAEFIELTITGTGAAEPIEQPSLPPAPTKDAAGA